CATVKKHPARLAVPPRHEDFQARGVEEPTRAENVRKGAQPEELKGEHIESASRRMSGHGADMPGRQVCGMSRRATQSVISNVIRPRLLANRSPAETRSNNRAGLFRRLLAGLELRGSRMKNRPEGDRS